MHAVITPSLWVYHHQTKNATGRNADDSMWNDFLVNPKEMQHLFSNFCEVSMPREYENTMLQPDSDAQPITEVK